MSEKKKELDLDAKNNQNNDGNDNDELDSTNADNNLESESEQGSEHGSSIIRIALLPLRDILVFPTTVVPLFVGREKSIQALEHAMATSKEIFLSAQIKAKVSDPTDEDIYKVGTISSIRQLLRLPDGTVKVLVEGKKRARIVKYIEKDEFFFVEAVPLEEKVSKTIENEALIRTVKMSFDNYVRLNKRIPPEMLLSISAIEDEEKLSDTLVSHLTNLKLADKQKLLEETDPKVRLEELYGFIQSEIEIMRVEKKIRARVKRQMEKSQKEYYLNEQMQAIQKELGEKGDDSRAEFQEIEDKINSKKLSEEAREKVNKEFKKLKQMSPMSAEATVVRNYLDMILSLPWEEYSEEIKDINVSEKILEEDHYGLEKVKERVLEFLAVRLLSDVSKGPILCLIGPPGVGKTSLATSVARAMGRKFARVALGGVKDEAEIRGHRRTYIGSMPGKIIMAMKKAGTTNPVILLDEIDKLSSDFRGDPSSALLEVLDPAQNHTFNDHYLDLDFDLSKVLFLATGNILHTIPKPLLDRMEVIHIPGYTDEEKMVIAKRHLIKRQLKENGLEDSGLNFSDEAIEELINYYTREAGVRNLEREIASIIRKVARTYLKESSKTSKDKNKDKDSSKTKKDSDSKNKNNQDKKLNLDLKISAKDVVKYLGPHKFRIGLQNANDEIGICTGLAWTEVGGELLAVEVNTFPGSGKLTITGKLGEVMQESAQAALSYVRSRAEFLGIKDDFKTIDIHIHVPEGAIPKDGPSAGLCMATALASALTKRPISKDIAMTGEITLRGRALPIGGLKEKLLAACRGGIKKVMIPEENKKDLEDVPNVVLKTMKIVPVKHMDEVLLNALVWKNSGKAKDELYKKLQESMKDNK